MTLRKDRQLDRRLTALVNLRQSLNDRTVERSDQWRQRVSEEIETLTKRTSRNV